jgi:hypothetical protein
MEPARLTGDVCFNRDPHNLSSNESAVQTHAWSGTTRVTLLAVAAMSLAACGSHDELPTASFRRRFSTRFRCCARGGTHSSTLIYDTSLQGSTHWATEFTDWTPSGSQTELKSAAVCTPSGWKQSTIFGDRLPSRLAEQGPRLITADRELSSGHILGGMTVRGRLPPAVRFGGIKESGYGRLGGIEGLRALMRTKNVWIGSEE